MTTTLAPATPTSSLPGRVLHQLGADTRYLLAGLPIATAAFVVLVTGFALSAGLLAVAVGLPVLGVTLLAARGFADVERRTLKDVSRGRPTPRPAYRAADPKSNIYRRAITPLTQGQSWLDLLHGIVNFVVSIVTFSLTVTWWASAAGGLTYGIWERFLPGGGNDVVVTAVLGSYSHVGEIALFTVAGAVFAITLVPVMRALTGIRAGISRALLVEVAEMRRETASS